MPDDPRNFWTVQYGLTAYSDLFTPRQLSAMTTFSDLVSEARERVKTDALAAGVRDDGIALQNGGTGGAAYADAVALYLAAFVSRFLDLNNALCQWRSDPAKQHVGHLFARQAIPMVWDFAEANPIGPSAGGFDKTFLFLPKVFPFLPTQSRGVATQADAQNQRLSVDKVVSTDPPYYDNIGYADLSDFFYVWLRRSLRSVFPDLFSTLTVPKADELVASPYRHGGTDRAEVFFLDGMTEAMHRLAEQAHPAFPITVYYAFKQAESRGPDGGVNTGWDTFLGAVIRAGLSISGTWPLRTELANRMLSSGTNALASSILIVCRARAKDAERITRRSFDDALRREMAPAVAKLLQGAIAPVDLQQAAIGPGMAVFSRYGAVIEANDQPMSVRTALQLINRQLYEVLSGQDAEYDDDTRWALAWFEQFGHAEGVFGTAETLATGIGISVDGLKRAGIVASGAGKVRLLKRDELDADWDPRSDARLTVWEVVQHLIRALLQGGEDRAGELLAGCGTAAESARDLAYRLFVVCERKGWAAEAGPYNALGVAWPAIAQRAANAPTSASQPRLV